MTTGGSEESLGSRYVLLEEIGAGGMGTVWRARSRDAGEIVAVKLLRDSLAGDQELVLRFVQERNVMRALRHPNIVTVRDFVIEGERLALVMDLVEGGDLRVLLQRQGTLPQAEAAQLMTQVADALAAAHALDIVHRDIKPGNVLIDGATGQVRLTDFGVARIVHGPGITQTTSIIGTPTYLSPEVADGSAPTPAVDVYALGLILYELVAGRPPFVGEHPMALLRQHATAMPRRLPGMSDALWEVISACVAKNPADRPRAGEVAVALRAAAPSLEGLPALPPVARGATPSATSEPFPPGLPQGSAPAGPGPRETSVGLRAGTAGADGTVASTRRTSSRRRVTVIAAATAALVLSGAAVVFVAPWRARDAEAVAKQADADPSKVVVVTSGDAVPPVPVVDPTKDKAKNKEKEEPKPPPKQEQEQKQEEPARTLPEKETVSQPPTTPPKPQDVKTPKPRESTLVMGEGEDGPSAPPSRHTTPDYMCRDWISAGPGTGVEMSPCIAVAGGKIYLKGRIRGSSAPSDILIEVYNTDAEVPVSQRFFCSGVSPSGGNGFVKCGPYTATVAPTGDKLDVRQRWRRAGSGDYSGGRESPWIRW